MTNYTLQGYPDTADGMEDVRDVMCDVGLQEFGSLVPVGRLDLDPLYYRDGLTEVSLYLANNGLRHLGYVRTLSQALQLLQQAVDEDIASGAFASCVGYRHAAMRRQRARPA
ncbi:hypothetical protein [Streptomyces sp. NPDC127114]|uniref:hypothetical protein n=1 Tax=Streptomyces sp. NPDC127114 TaxID=3345366 RepID=UPI00363793FA